MSECPEGIEPSDMAEPAVTNRRLGPPWFCAAAAVGLCLWLWGCATHPTEPDTVLPLSEHPLTVSTEARTEGACRILRLSLDDPRWRKGQVPPLVKDHGKWVHMFLIREPELDAFAHVHPQPVDRSTFDVALPPLPEGDYRVYIDLRHEGDLIQTSTSTARLPPPPSSAAPGDPPLAPDTDDSWGVASEVRGDIFRFPDGHFMMWDREVTLTAGKPVPLRFMLLRPDGKPADLELYMGMLAHAAVRDRDASIFGHLHAMGPMDSMEMSADTDDSSGTGDMAGTDMSGHRHDAFASFPSIGLVAMGYTFPEAETYRVWTQIKSSGTVYTGVFDLNVGP